MRIDHILIFVGDDGSESAEFERFGLVPGRRVTHPGQGTSNTCFAFDNCYLELLWCSDSAEIKSPAIRPTGMWQRARWWETEACPVGFALRCTEPDEPLPFDTTDYRPPFLPDELDAIRISAKSADVAEPFLFVMPDVMPTLKSEPHQVQENLGLNRITRVEMILPFDYRRSEQLTSVVERGLVSFQMGDSYHLVLEADDRRMGRQRIFQHPRLPVTISW